MYHTFFQSTQAAMRLCYKLCNLWTRCTSQQEAIFSSKGTPFLCMPTSARHWQVRTQKELVVQCPQRGIIWAYLYKFLLLFSQRIKSVRREAVCLGTRKIITLLFPQRKDLNWFLDFVIHAVWKFSLNKQSELKTIKICPFLRRLTHVEQVVSLMWS